ncbi:MULTISPECIES: aldehyde dehydrogenase family protein [unclassified Shinella]|uniref:aldehyde dehydrogenase family protein n=1 Tax=unclassified Shinella TaxID=2643062 RepID=UPI00234F47B2|nr:MULTISPECIES: aldehyde dehydrogenase family protein [unclassified Shinella]MCO5153548.1 aldehyde dehydrogenase family protein [Shinella sp.]MDC7265779.1 aldehyde dehydrogenase family protein [Shinella sp. HY16]MDC7272676.1 aldehyde dehydrogenase family protein [Shinella sp. YZ44]
MRHQLFIDGRWQDPVEPGRIPVFDPYRGTVYHEVSAGGPADVDKAVAAAKAAFPAWRDAGGRGRARYLAAIAARLTERAEELARLSSRNNGKPLGEARIDMADAAASFAYYAEQAIALQERQDADVALPDDGFHARLRQEPAGVASLIVPWNFPLVTTSWKVAPALAAGCTVVLKPSEITPVVELELGAIAEDVGLPPGVLNIITGTGERVGAPMTTHPDVAKISFTGSNAVGARVMAACAPGVKSVSLELGGKSPIVVFANADFDEAVDCVLGGIFFNAGQMCSATSRLLVERSIAPKLIDAIIAGSRALNPGDPLDEGTTIGPITMKAQHDKVLSYIERGKAEGLTLLAGGGKPAAAGDGWFVEPTIFGDVPTTSALWREEIFGPVLCIRTFESEEEAIALANDCDFGLVATVVSGDDVQANRVANAIEAGHVWINSPQAIFVQTSWGGFKASGIGRELGPWGMSSYLEVKHVTSRLKR